MSRQFNVVVERDAEGFYVATVPALPGCHTQARSLDQLMDELASCDALLTNDTGTMHLAASLGVPTAAIFGSTEPDLTSPLGDFHQILRHKVECSPCFLRECPIDFRCMTGIGPSEASAALQRALAAPTS